MANTNVLLTQSGETFAPSISSVAAVEGDTVTFSTGGGSLAFLFLSPDAITLLSPTPVSPVPVSSTPVTFSFTSSSPGRYSIFFETSASAETPPFPVIPSDMVALLIDPTKLSFGTPVDSTKGR